MEKKPCQEIVFTGVVDAGGQPKPKGEKGTCGDVRFDEVESIVAGISSVPGGVGSATNAVLSSHVVEAERALSGKTEKGISQRRRGGYVLSTS